CWRVHGAGFGFRGERGLGSGGDLYRAASWQAGSHSGRRRDRRIAPDLESLAPLKRLRVPVGGLELDIKCGDFHDRTPGLRGDESLTAAVSRT
ncbi:hypothetical protein RZS08_10415, partial [Arthrospira platensis SPKY1]|nr:hypothetical protein [Arthrospira platensis SPKY1]